MDCLSYSPLLHSLTDDSIDALPRITSVVKLTENIALVQYSMHPSVAPLVSSLELTYTAVSVSPPVSLMTSLQQPLEAVGEFPLSGLQTEDYEFMLDSVVGFYNYTSEVYTTSATDPTAVTNGTEVRLCSSCVIMHVAMCN